MKVLCEIDTETNKIAIFLRDGQDQEEAEDYFKTHTPCSPVHRTKDGVYGGVDGFDFDELPTDYMPSTLKKLEENLDQFFGSWSQGQRWFISGMDYEIANDCRRLLNWCKKHGSENWWKAEV